ncbi:hypothetical protein SAY86_005701 [Trapa natans]|uniref:Uncharacterized protein n=1 Tax=Trapa natans TaxID=22666 RepID=A0AAN7KVC8_TRANT|nr:hypothetical protein SAY86_005701 [Trapa natans]
MSDGKGTNYSSKIKTLGDGEVLVTVVESPAKIGAAMFDVFNQREASLLEIEDVSHEHASHAAIRASGSDGETHFNVKMSPPSSRTSPWLIATVWSRRPR